jgi:hypothetical protein
MLYSRYGIAVKIVSVGQYEDGRHYANLEGTEDPNWSSQYYPIYWLRADGGMDEVVKALLDVCPDCDL